MSTDEKKVGQPSGGDNAGGGEKAGDGGNRRSGSGKKRPARRRRRRRSVAPPAPAAGSPAKGGDEQRDKEVTETSLGPGRKRRVFRRHRKEGAEADNQGVSDSENSRSEGQGRRGRRRSSGESSGGRRRRGEKSRDRDRGSDRQQRDNRRGRSRGPGGRDRKPPIRDEYAPADTNAPDGAFDGHDFGYSSGRNHRRVNDDLEASVAARDVAFFSSAEGQDFTSMKKEDVQFLKPHEIDQGGLYDDMPLLDALPSQKGHLMDVVGVKTHATGTIDIFNCDNTVLVRGEEVIVETKRGLAFGKVMVATTRRVVNRHEMPRVFRMATRNDMRQADRNRQRAAEALTLCARTIQEFRLEMKLVEVSYLHGGNKAVFYFLSESRVDFRQLVKKLARELHVRVEMRQIGVRDASRMVGGLGPCGQPLCCGRFIRDFMPVSIRMAKDQDLVLNPEKVSGQCGRLMCCLSYEQKVYREQGKGMPKVGKFVLTPDGRGRVRDRDILRRLVRVQLDEENSQKTFSVEEVEPANRPGGGGPRKNEQPEKPTGRAGTPSAADSDKGTEQHGKETAAPDVTPDTTPEK